MGHLNGGCADFRFSGLAGSNAGACAGEGDVDDSGAGNGCD